MANDGLITEVVSKQAIQELQNFEKQLLSVFEQINKFSTVKVNLPSQLATATAGSASSIQKTIQLRQQSEKVIERERLAELKLQRDREQAFDKYDRQLQKEQQKLSASENIYNKVQAKLRRLGLEYTDLATRKELGLRLTDDEIKRYDYLQGRIQRYDKVLKGVDASMGRYQRNVGNYASAFNPLSNSINQLTREAPAFAVSLNTGFLAISNNLPIFFDAIQQVIAQNKQLQAQGQPTQSVFKQIAASIFSFQTLLSVGVTLLTLYGGQIIDAFTGGSKAADNLKKNLSDVGSIYTEQAVKLGIVKDVINDTTTSQINLNKALKIAEQNGISLNAIELARSGNLSAINKEIDNQITLSIKQAKAQKLVSLIVENEIEANKIRRDANETQDKWYNKLIKSASRVVGFNQVEIDLAKNKRQEAEELDKVTQAYYDELKKLGLEALIDDEKATKSKKQQIELLKDFGATAAELTKLRLENESNIQQRILEDEEQNLERREVALKAYHEIQRQLADNALAESLRVTQVETDNEIKAIQERIKTGEREERNGNAVIYSLRKDAEYKNLIAYEQYAEALRGIDISIVESMRGVANEINFGKAEGLINERDLRATTEYVDKLQEIVKQNKDYREIQKANKEFQLANQGITKANIQLEIDRIETELRGIKDTEANVQKRIKLENSLILKRKELANVTKEEAEEQAAALEKLQKATESYLNSFTSGAFASFGLPIIDTLTKIEENGKSVFQNLIEGANTTGEKFAVVFNSSLEVAQQFYNALQQYNNQRFEREYANEERSYNIATQFYAKTDAARQELDRQYEEKRREIKRRELQAQKEQAIFNAIINTAQAVTSALPNYVLAALVGALGAAQIALISSQQIPAYKDGGENLQGLAWVGDGGRSEIIKTPSGDLFRTPATDTLVNLPKGSNVYRSEADFIRKHSGALFNSPAVDWQGGRMPTAKEIGIELGNQIKNMPTSVANFDKSGFNYYVSNGHGKKTTFDNKVTMKGLRVK